SGVCGVAEPEPADQDVQVAPVQRGQGEGGQCPFGDGEQAGHQVLLAQPHLVDLGLRGQVVAAAQTDLTDRCLLEVELFEPGHVGTLLYWSGQLVPRSSRSMSVPVTVSRRPPSTTSMALGETPSGSALVGTARLPITSSTVPGRWVRSSCTPPRVSSRGSR